MKRIKGGIARRLIAGITMMTVLVLGTAALSVYTVHHISNHYLVALDRTNLAALGVEIRSETLTLFNLALRYTTSTPGTPGRQLLKEQIENRRNNLNGLIERTVEMSHGGDPNERTQLAHIQQRIVYLNLQIDRLIQTYESENRYGESTAREIEILTQDYEIPLTQDLNAFQSYEAKRTQSAREMTGRAMQTMLILLGMTALLSTIIMAFLIWRSFVRIILPLAELNAGVEQFRLGYLNYTIPVKSRDEIGVLAETFNTMVYQLRMTVQGLESNIAELEQAHEALSRNAELYRSLFNGIPAGLYRTTTDGRFINANAALAEMLGYPDPESLQATSTVSLYADPEARKQWQALLDSGEVVHDFETRMFKRDGSVFWVRDSGRVVRDSNGRLLYYEGSLMDITERRRVEDEIRRLNEELEQRVIDRTEELHAANRELESFSYSVSHDLRAPLRSIDGFSRILMEDHQNDLSPDARRYLELVRTNARQMAMLIEDLLNFSKTSRQALHRQTVAPTETVHQVLQELSPLQENRNIKLSIGDLPACEADPALLKVVYANILSNALKFTRRRETAVIEAGCLIEEGEAVYFIRDNGAGFDMKYVDKVFAVFQRLHRSSDFEGTGVGMSIVQRIINRHGGRVWVDSAVDKGTTFYFTFGKKTRLS